MVVHAANIQDRDGAKLVLSKMVGRYPRLKVRGIRWQVGSLGLGHWRLAAERGPAEAGHSLL